MDIFYALNNLNSSLTLLALRFSSLLKQLERALLGLVARLNEVLERLLAEGVLLSADDATLVLHQVLAC